MTSVNEILDQATGVEARLEGCLETIRDRTPDGGVRLLTYNLRRRCSRLRVALEALYPGEREAAEKLAYHGRNHVGEGPAARFGAAPPETVTSAELLGAALEHGRAMTILYGDLMQHDLPKDLAAALQTLREREQKDVGMLQKMIETKYPELPDARA